jgi:hypothetical protein
LELTMDKKERNRGSVDRARAKRGSAGDMSAEEFDAALARMRTAASFDAETQNEDFFRGMSAETQNEDFFRGMSAEDTMKMLRGPTRPMPNPRRSVEAPGSGLDQGPSRAEMELGPLSAPSRSLRPQPRPKRFEEGGMVTGSRAQLSGTKFSGTF